MYTSHVYIHTHEFVYTHTYIHAQEAALLGEGAFGKTFTMRSSLDGQLYAVKMINVLKAERNGLPVDNLKREVQMLLRLAHTNIIR
jgi:hypothetical protein